MRPLSSAKIGSMSSLASRAPEAVQRRRRELRAVKLLLAGLAVVTALVSFALFSAASFTLLVLPFVVFVVCCAFVLPMDGFDRHAAESSANLLLQRRAEAERHAFVPPVSSAESAVQLSAANLSQTQTAMAAAEAHGIRFACAHLSDGDFLHRFTAGELRAEDFRHGDHLRFAWLALERLPFDMAEESVAQNLRTFLRRISGSNAQFHATHTHGWVRVLAAMHERTFAEVLAAHAVELRSTALTRYWSKELLASAAARSTAVPTDAQALPEPAARRTRRYRQGRTSLPPAPYAPTVATPKGTSAISPAA